MTIQPFQPRLDFEAATTAAEDGEALIVDLEGYEGPLHALLALARQQKVDLLKLSILKLAEQYLAFVQKARHLRFTLAADYLVMAAWLAYLKSRLLLPKPDKGQGDDPPAEEMAAALAFRLARLDAIRTAAEALRARPQLGRDLFVRGDPEQVRIIPSSEIEGDLYSLMKAYADQRRSGAARTYQPLAQQAYPLEEARQHLRAQLGDLKEWRTLAVITPEPALDGPGRGSYLASTLAASLELIKEGALEAKQMDPFADIYLRARHRQDIGA